jgi:isochorismate synthase
LPHYFTKLAKVYPFAFVSAIYLPETKVTWLGASPEILVSKDEKGIFKTMSLAGTQSAFDTSGNRKNPNNALWSQKEIEEQSFVSRYIIECFKKIRVREYLETGPKTIEAGNLFHLRTDYLVDTKAINFTEMASVMLNLLHPTSAVCGTPKTAALNYILANEGYDREYYSGFLGPVNIEGQSSLYVNLRTMKIEGENAKVFAGAGITEDSDPENEWLETEMKTNTLLSIFE